MSRILVTGGRGFIGRHALPLLIRAGYDVHAVSSRDATGEVADVTWHRANLLRPGEPKRVAEHAKADTLLHVAWYAEPGKYWTSPLNGQWVEASMDLARAFARAGGRRIVGAGSSAEYDWSNAICGETAPLAPTTPYGEAKRALSERLADLGSEVGLEIAWGRVFFLYGPHEHPARLVPSVVRPLLRGEPAKCTHGRQCRDFLYVEDVASAFVALVGSTVTGPVNVASGEAVPVREVVAYIAARLGRPDLVEFGALPERSGDPELLVADVTRLREVVAWRPTYDLSSGLDRTIAWWRTHLEEFSNTASIEDVT